MARNNKTFKVADHVGKMSADFRPMAQWSGPISEPSQEQFNAWQVGMSQLAAEFNFDGDPNDMRAVAEFMANLDVEDLDVQADRTAEMYADLCSNSPSKDDLLSLPPRWRQAFYGYVSGELAPEASSPAGKS